VRLSFALGFGTVAVGRTSAPEVPDL